MKIHLILLFSVEEWLLWWMLRIDFHFINFVFNNSVQSSVFLSGLYYVFLWEENLTQHSSIVVFFRTKATNHILQLGVHIFSVFMFTSKLFACLSIPTQLDVNCNLWCYLHTVVSKKLKAFARKAQTKLLINEHHYWIFQLNWPSKELLNTLDI